MLEVEPKPTGQRSHAANRSGQNAVEVEELSSTHNVRISKTKRNRAILGNVNRKEVIDCLSFAVIVVVAVSPNHRKDRNTVGGHIVSLQSGRYACGK